jgi:hypothetical protein
LILPKTTYHDGTEARFMERIKVGCGEGSFNVIRAGR